MLLKRKQKEQQGKFWKAKVPLVFFCMFVLFVSSCCFFVCLFFTFEGRIKTPMKVTNNVLGYGIMLWDMEYVLGIITQIFPLSLVNIPLF